MHIYDIKGKDIAAASEFANNMNLDYEFDESGNANYQVLRIFKKRIDGSEQYPFVYVPNGTGAGTQSTLSMNSQKGFMVAINAGTFDMTSLTPHGLVIQNGELIQQKTIGENHWALTIDNQGNLSYASAASDGNELIQNGIISAVTAWSPIIIDYGDAADVIDNTREHTTDVQMQIIGQFGNGDYAIVTCEGRGNDHSDGWTHLEAKAICMKLGLKYAFYLDGGGSTETVIGKKQINTIYEGTYGRVVPTYIVFNGTSIFSVPE